MLCHPSFFCYLPAMRLLGCSAQEQQFHRNLLIMQSTSIAIYWRYNILITLMTSQSRSPLQYARIAAAQSTASAAGCINRSIYRQKFALSRHSSLHPHQQNIPPANKRVNLPSSHTTHNNNSNRLHIAIQEFCEWSARYRRRVPVHKQFSAETMCNL